MNTHYILHGQAGGSGRAEPAAVVRSKEGTQVPFGSSMVKTANRREGERDRVSEREREKPEERELRTDDRAGNNKAGFPRSACPKDIPHISPGVKILAA